MVNGAVTPTSVSLLHCLAQQLVHLHLCQPVHLQQLVQELVVSGAVVHVIRSQIYITVLPKRNVQMQAETGASHILETIFAVPFPVMNIPVPR